MTDIIIIIDIAYHTKKMHRISIFYAIAPVAGGVEIRYFCVPTTPHVERGQSGRANAPICALHIRIDRLQLKLVLDPGAKRRS
jgi:hypothetical protein